MQKTFVCIALVIAFLQGSSQNNLEDYGPALGRYMGEHTSTSVNRINEIWMEDFENGIPESWTNEELSGIASWEYRGANTNPDYYIGSRGSCIPEGQDGSAPIQSESWDNGFVIFDSNYWDDNIGPCIAGFGTGPSPAPHSAALSTGSIDLSSHQTANLMFTQYFKEWTNNTTAKVQGSVDGGEWVDLYTLTLESGNSTEPDALVIIDISAFAGGHEDVKIRFLFEGTYYYWMVDDVVIFEPDVNNMDFQDVNYGDFDVFNEDNETGFEYLEYSMYPQEMAPYLYLSAHALNVGSDTQNNVVVDVKIENTGTEEIIYSETSSPQNIFPQSNLGVTLPGFQMPNSTGHYQLTYEVTQDQEDDEPENNIEQSLISITDVVYARDNRETEGIFVPSSIYNGNQYELGNMFVITESNMEAYSISMGVGVGSQVGSMVYGAIYKLDISQGLTPEFVAQTESAPVYWEALNGIGQSDMMVLPFTEPLTLDKDSAYLVVAGSESGPQDVMFASSGQPPAYSSWARFFPSNFGYLLGTPMVRLNFGEIVDVKEYVFTALDVQQNFPNPFSDRTAIQYSLNIPGNVSIDVHDMTGRLLSSKNLGTRPAGKHTAFIERGTLSSGIYMYTFRCNDMTKTSTMLVR
ncbi:MAG: hypothetical protein ACI84C_000125 [Flavobacteriales bacterium]|jgi:hypothetical protein